ncbi:MAG: hypothetical protein ACRC5M_05480, partial [Anaeroplasmataceae bacterium]
DDVRDRLDNNKISLKDVVANVSSCADNSTMYHTYSSFQDAFFAKDCFNKDTSILNLLDKYYSMSDLNNLDLYSYHSITELDEHISLYSMPPRIFIESNIMKYVIPVINKVNSSSEESVMKGFDITPSDVINLFNTSMISLDFIGEFGQGVSLKVEEKKSQMEPVNSFTQQTTTTTTTNTVDREVSSQSTSEMLILNDMTGYKFYKIFIPKSRVSAVKEKYNLLQELDIIVHNITQPNETLSTVENVVVGYMAIKDKQDPCILINPKENITNFSGILPASKLGVVFSNTIKLLSKDKAPKYRYTDAEAAVYYANFMNAYISIALENM